MTPRTVLVVEDNPVTRKMMRLALESERYDVLEAGDGRTALELAKGRPPDIVVQDYVLPDMDGLQLAEGLRALPGLSDLPIVVVTGMVSRIEELRARAGSSITFLPKPLEPSRLVEIVRTHLEGGAGNVGHGRRVLVVDDEPLNLKLAALRLRDAGFEVETASSGEEALQKAPISRPDAILSDILMPGMDGFVLCAAVRQHTRLSHIPVVLLSSAYVDAADRKLARDMGASALLLRTPDLREAIGALTESLQAGPPPAAAVDTMEMTARHRERMQVQLERQVARNEALLRQGAIQASALSVIRALTEGLARPEQIPKVLGDVLVHCLDAAGLSTGLMYLIEPDGQLHLQAQTGLTSDTREEATGCFGYPEALRRIMDRGEPAAYPAGPAEPEEPALRAIASRMASRSILIAPFVVAREPFGALVLVSGSQDLSEGTWLGFARTLAVQFGQTVALGRSLARGAASEARYRSLMERASDAILLLDAARTIVEANRQTEALFRRPRLEIVGRPYDELVVPDEREESLAGWARLLAEGTIRVEGRRLLRADGTGVAVDISSSVVKVGEETVVLSILRDITERKVAERKLAESEEQFRQVFAGALDAMVVTDDEGRFLEANPAACELYGCPRPDLLKRSIVEFAEPGSRFEQVRAAVGTTGRLRASHHVFRPDGTTREVEASTTGNVVPGRHFSALRDVTEHRQLEGQLRQAQKMEAIGQLAGGVAHDFNNLLGVITGYSELLKKRLEPEHAGQKALEQIREAADRAAALTRQLLAFSRKQVLEPKILDLNEILAGVDKMLRRLIGEDVQIQTRFAADLGQVKADPGQVEQVIMNLAVNARDAMPRGGQLILETANTALDGAYARTHTYVLPGPYVMLAVSDTGHGMDADTLSHIFEPFFTTKEPGKGTGLGLATVFGIVKQSGGHVNVYSEPGRGSTFKVYLPRIEEVAAPREETAAPPPPPSGTETILVVEDAVALGVVIREVLEGGGYTVLDASQPEEALAAAKAHPGPVHLMLTDVVLPRMSGPDLAARLERGRPGIRVLYMSGYTADAIGNNGVLEPGTYFIQKPFTADALLHKLREVLDASRPSVPGGVGGAQ